MLEEVRLTRFSHGAGCACKLGPAHLTQVLDLVGPSVKPDEVLVSEETGDDAAVYRLDDERALIATVDVFTPVVDDAYDWGRIAAANALSDVYAMGGEPAIALNVAGWPVDALPVELLADVLRGGRDVATEAGAAVVGGHTITTEKEPIYGMVVFGFAEPGALIRNDGLRPGMSLVLTKPLGTGILTTAIKRDEATGDQASTVVATMTTLNADAARAARATRVRAGTDVTGFGLLGHLHRMAAASGVSATIDAGAVPLLEGVLDLARRDVVPSGTKRNHAWLSPSVVWGDLTVPEQMVFADAQTSGGLLLGTEDPEALLAELGVGATVGRVDDGPAGRLSVDGRIDG